MPKVVADANVYISAILFGGKPSEVRNLARQRKIELLLSEAILDQIARVLKRKFDWPDWQISETIEELRTSATLITPKETLKVIKEKESDNRILECAVEGKAQYIVSGDERHLLPLKEYQGIKILSPAEFFENFLGDLNNLIF
jgi:putative PIN family toxin of toxin-antitoxin system